MWQVVIWLDEFKIQFDSDKYGKYLLDINV